MSDRYTERVQQVLAADSSRSTRDATSESAKQLTSPGVRALDDHSRKRGVVHLG